MTEIIKKLPPNEVLHKIESRRVLVFAAHPTDAIIGCAGAVMRHVDAGDALRIIVATNNAAHADDVQRVDRAKQLWAASCSAAKILGCSEPESLELPHGCLVYGEDLVQRIVAMIEADEIELVYVTSIFEKGINRHALAMSVVEAVRRSRGGVKLAMYALYTPMPRRNIVIDVSDCLERKEKAIACLSSLLNDYSSCQQESESDQFWSRESEEHLDSEEAYFVSISDILKSDFLEIYSSEYWRQNVKGLTFNNPSSPKVSVIVRSVDRPYLQDALNSLALQTYPTLEVLVINARGTAHTFPGTNCGRFPQTLLSTGAPMNRVQAANFGLVNATGEYILFLDDDDWLAPNHVSGLIAALQNNRNNQVAYAGVSVRDENRVEMAILPFNWNYSAGRLRSGNYIPIHAMIFARSLLERGVHFDESFDVYEDWDFILQLSQLTEFSHVDTVSAYYRASGTSGVGIHADAALQHQSRVRIFEKWGHMWSGEQLDAMVQSTISFEKEKHIQQQQNTLGQLEQAHLALTDAHSKLNAVHSDYKNLDAELTQSRTKLAQSNAQLDRVNLNLEAKNDQLEKLTLSISELEKQLVAKDLDLQIINGRLFDMIHSASWRVSAPIRWFGEAKVNLKHGIYKVIASIIGKKTWPAGPPIVTQGFCGEEITKPASTGKRPLVSVIMPVYNACRADKRFLLRAIESIANQTYSNVELIIVNDGSTDDTQAVCQEYLSLHPNLRAQFLNKKNGGQSEARNFGAKACNGDYVGFLDQDDEWYENKLEQVIPWLENENIDVIYTDSDSIDGDDKVTLGSIHKKHNCGWPHPKKSIDDILFKDIFVMPGLMTIKKTAFDKIGGFDAKLSGYEDDDLFLRLFETCRIFYLPTPTLRWRMYGDNYSFSHRMLTSRSYYWKKLLTNYTNGGKDELRTQMISLRFFWEFLNQSVAQYLVNSELCWASLNGAKEISPYLPRMPRILFSLIFLLPNKIILESIVRGRKLIRST